MEGVGGKFGTNFVAGCEPAVLCGRRKWGACRRCSSTDLTALTKVRFGFVVVPGKVLLKCVFCEKMLFEFVFKLLFCHVLLLKCVHVLKFGDFALFK